MVKNEILKEPIKLRYGVEPSEDARMTLAAIARARGFLIRGGEVDEERAAYAVIDDCRKGRMGKRSVEKA